MSCGSEFYTSNCVCDTLLAIVEAQDRVDPGCSSGCNRAIQELVGGVAPGTFDTVPVLLTCKNTCAPFTAIGAVRNPAVNGGNGVGTVFIPGVLFRVIDVDPETCCATLEILTGPEAYTVPSYNGSLPSTGALIGDVTAVALAGTGACITVDLNCFCAVTCAPATTLGTATIQGQNTSY